VGIYSTERGQQIQKIMGVPRSTNNFVISGNGRKLLFGNNNTICLYDVARGDLDISSNQWRNVNCYAISKDGKQFVLGTYSGSLLIITRMS